MGYRLTGVSTPFAGLQWEKTSGDREIGRRVVTFLEDKRLLFGERHFEDERSCVASALNIREFLTVQIAEAKPGKELEIALRAMRAACRRFVDVGGPDARDFTYQHFGQMSATFFLALGDLRTAIGFQLGLILSQYPFEIEWDLASIIPKLEPGD